MININICLPYYARNIKFSVEPEREFTKRRIHITYCVTL